MILGLISDTHGLLRDSALRAMQNTGIIIHAGDVGDPKILKALEKLAPVTAVRGNVDSGEWAIKLPQTAVVKLDAVRIYVLHDVKELKLQSIPAGVSAGDLSDHASRLGRRVARRSGGHKQLLPAL